MDIHAAIVDDCEADREFIHGLVRQWSTTRGWNVSIDLFPSAEAFWFRYSDDPNFDLLLLDIEMQGMDGVSLARRLRKENDAAQIVFITGYSDYIAEGYEVAALHFLVKPVRPEKLCAVLDRAAEKLLDNEHALTLDLGEEIVRVPLRRVRYVEVMRNYVTVHADKSYTVRQPLSELAQKLDDRFLRIGRSYMVNLYQIRSVSKSELLLLDGSRVPMPRGAYEKVNQAILHMR